MPYKAPPKVIFKPSAKVKQVWREAPLAKFRWLEGAVRSSKSFVANDIAIAEIQKLPPCDVLISGFSITSVARNILAEWRKTIDPYDFGLFRNVKEGKDDFLTINWRGLRGKKFYIRGAGKESDFKAIQGATFGYWLADETTRHHEKFFDMAISRLSPDFAKAIGTTNPDSPYHYFKTRILDNEELYHKDEDGKSLHAQWKFFLRDNPSLSEEYIQTLERTYSGVFYKRYVQSQWVLAEGVIYDFFEKESHTYNGHIPMKFPVVGIDYGTSTVMCFILFLVNLDPYAKVKMRAVREYVWDVAERGKQKTDAEFSADLKDWLGGVDPYKIIVDPSAASFKVQLRKDGYFQVENAVNDIVNGIRTQMTMLKSGEYLINEKGCPRTIKDYGGYSWDERAQLRGEDVPASGPAEHTKDVERYVAHTLFGNYYGGYEYLTNL